MDKLIRKGIVQILSTNEDLLRIPVRQRAKFEGWLKFELASYLESVGMRHVEVESHVSWGRQRTDIAFSCNDEPYGVELKTPNTNWRIPGVKSSTRPITRNIQSVIDDAIKLDSTMGIVAFVLFPIPLHDERWVMYLDRIREDTQTKLTEDDNCELVDMHLGDGNRCSLVVCAFRSRQ